MHQDARHKAAAGTNAPAHASRLQRWLIGLIAVGVALVVLKQGRFFLVPLAIAVLLFSLAGAAIARIANIDIAGLRVPNWLASIVAVLLTAAGLLTLFALAMAQIDSVVATASAYTNRAEQSLAALFAWFGDDVSQAMLIAFQDINLGEYIRAFAGSAGNLLLTTMLVILYVGFLFAERPWFEAKVARLFPAPGRAEEVGDILAAIARSVHHYMLVKTAVSLATGLAVYAIFRLYGLDFAETLAILAFILNFIPNIGSIVATALPAVVALVQFDGWSSILSLILLVGAVQFGIGNILDPLLMGRTLHLSSLAVVISLTFWGAIWGVVGMFLAVPIMVMVMIVCAHIPALRPIAILLSRDGTLPAERDGTD